MTKREDTFTALVTNLQAAALETPFRVFLCGPKISLRKSRPAAALRSRIRDVLVENKFDVVLGEDEGLLNQEISKLGVNAQDSELLYIKEHCNAIIIVADSVGSYCELGLFSWHHAHRDGLINADGKDFILLIDQKFKRHQSYFNLGPARSVSGGRGLIEFVNFEKFRVERLVKRLVDQRGVAIAGRVGRRKARRA